MTDWMRWIGLRIMCVTSLHHYWNFNAIDSNFPPSLFLLFSSSRLIRHFFFLTTSSPFDTIAIIPGSNNVFIFIAELSHVHNVKTTSTFNNVKLSHIFYNALVHIHSEFFGLRAMMLWISHTWTFLIGGFDFAFNALIPSLSLSLFLSFARYRLTRIHHMHACTNLWVCALFLLSFTLIRHFISSKMNSCTNENERKKLYNLLSQ